MKNIIASSDEEFVMVITSPDGRQLVLLRESASESPYKRRTRMSRQGKAIIAFMRGEEAWLKLQAKTQSSQKTAQS